MNTHFQSINSRFLELTSLLDEYHAGCDLEFDSFYDDLEREFAELRFTINQ